MLSCYIELLNQPGVYEKDLHNPIVNAIHFEISLKRMDMMCEYQCILKILKDHTQYFPEILKKKYLTTIFNKS